jgi:hypothetical protein
MDKYIKLTLTLLLILGSLYYLYLETKKHNLDVVNSVRLCANLNGDAVKACSDAVKKSYVFR